jgi:hypothetical protein
MSDSLIKQKRKKSEMKNSFPYSGVYICMYVYICIYIYLCGGLYNLVNGSHMIYLIKINLILLILPDVVWFLNSVAIFSKMYKTAY